MTAPTSPSTNVPLTTVPSSDVTHRMDRLRATALQDLPWTPSKARPKTLIAALLHLDVPAVLEHLDRVLDDPAALAKALTPIVTPKALAGREASLSQGNREILSPLGAVVRAPHRFRTPEHAHSATVQAVQTDLIGLLLALNAPVQDADWYTAMEAVGEAWGPNSKAPPAVWLDMLIGHGTPIPVAAGAGDDTLLTMAAEHPNHWSDRTVTALIDAGVPLDQVSYHGTAVGLAVAGHRDVDVQPGQQGLLTLLLNAGANPSLGRMSDGQPPIHRAVMNRDANALDLLLKHGADPCQVWVDDSEEAEEDPTLRSGSHGDQPLHTVVLNETPALAPLMDRLLAAGAFVNAINAHTGNTPLHEAFYHRHPAAAERLVLAGASLDALNTAGQRPVERLDDDPRGPDSSLGTDPLAEDEEEEQFLATTQAMRDQGPHYERLALTRVLVEDAAPLPMARTRQRTRL